MEDFKNLYESVNSLDEVFTEDTAKAINRNVTSRNWLIGYYIVNYEQNGSDRAQYGAKVVKTLAERLNKPSLSFRNLQVYKQFFIEFPELQQPIINYVINEFRENKPVLTSAQKASISNIGIVQTVSAQFQLSENNDVPRIDGETLFKSMSFSHLALMFPIKDQLKRTFYEHECIKGVWSFRELKRQIDSNYFERMAISSNPAKMSAVIQNKTQKTNFKDLLKSPMVFEFLGLAARDVVEESELEQCLIDNLETFILELGQGFCFEARQKRILVDDEYFYCDLVFYHRILKCHVLIDLKSKKLNYSDMAQMNMYLGYYNKKVMQTDDNPPVGIIMCTEAGQELVEYTSVGIDENLFVQKYLTHLPKKEELTNWLKAELSKTSNR